MYTIGNIVIGYSIPMGRTSRHVNARLGLYEYIDECQLEPEDFGFEQLYSGSGYPSKYIGVCVGEFNAIENFKVSELLPRFVATPEQIQKAAQMLAHFKSKLAERASVQYSQQDDPSIEWSYGPEKYELVSWLEPNARQDLLDTIPDCPELYLVWSDS